MGSSLLAASLVRAEGRPDDPQPVKPAVKIAAISATAAVRLAVFRIGYQIPLPIINQAQVAKNMEQSQEGSTFRFIEHVSIFSAADLRRITIFGLGIMPYISASIILQLLGSVYKPLEELRKEGETGRKKINEYTRYLTVLMCLVQGAIYLGSMLGGSENQASNIAPEFAVKNGALHPAWYFTVILMMTCGTMFVTTTVFVTTLTTGTSLHVTSES